MEGRFSPDLPRLSLVRKSGAAAFLSALRSPRVVLHVAQALQDAEEFAEDAEARCKALYAAQAALQRRLDEALSAKAALGSRCVALECEASRLDAELTEARRSAREALSAASTPTPRLAGAAAQAGRGGAGSRASSRAAERAAFSAESPRAARGAEGGLGGAAPGGSDGGLEDDDFEDEYGGECAAGGRAAPLAGGPGSVSAPATRAAGRHAFDDFSWDVRTPLDTPCSKAPASFPVESSL